MTAVMLGFDVLGTNGLLLLLLVAGPVMAAYGVAQVIADLRGAPRKKVVSRLRGRSGSPESAAWLAGVPADIRKQAPTARGALAQAVSRLSVTARLQAMLDQANLPWSAAQVLVNVAAIAAVVAALLMLLKVPMLTALGIAAAVMLLPLVYLSFRRKRRLNRLVQQLPDVFELLSQALRAGHSLASGFQVIASELPDPAGTEFGRVYQEQNLGLKIEEALQNMADRVDILDVRFFVTAVLIQRQTGGDLAEVLDKIGGVIRDRIKLFGTVKALTAEGRLSGYVLLALPVIVYLAMLHINRDYALVLVNHPTGQMMATFAIVMQLMGWAMIKKIVNIRV